MKNVTIINPQVDRIAFITDAQLKSASAAVGGVSHQMDNVNREEVKLNKIVNRQSFTNKFIDDQIDSNCLDHVREEFVKKVQSEVDKLHKLGVDVFANQTIPTMDYDEVCGEPYQSMTYNYLVREDQMHFYLYRNGVTTQAIAEHAEIARKSIYKTIDKIWDNRVLYRKSSKTSRYSHH